MGVILTMAGAGFMVVPGPQQETFSFSWFGTIAFIAMLVGLMVLAAGLHYTHDETIATAHHHPRKPVRVRRVH